jgi:hypothetical protein
MSIGNYLYFCFYRSVFKICQSFTATYYPQIWEPCTQALNTRSSNLETISCQQKYLTLIFFCLFAGWGECHGKQGWLQAGEDMCALSRKVARFETVTRTDFKLQQEYIWRNTRIHTSFSVLCKHIHIYIHELCKLQDVFNKKDNAKRSAATALDWTNNPCWIFKSFRIDEHALMSSCCREFKSPLRTISKQAVFAAMLLYIASAAHKLWYFL